MANNSSSSSSQCWNMICYTTPIVMVLQRRTSSLALMRSLRASKPSINLGAMWGVGDNHGVNVGLMPQPIPHQQVLGKSRSVVVLQAPQCESNISQCVAHANRAEV